MHQPSTPDVSAGTGSIWVHAATPHVIHHNTPAHGSLAGALQAGARPAALVYPGVDGGWPSALEAALIGRPELDSWLDAVVDELDAWAATPPVRAMGAFADGFTGVVRSQAHGGALAGMAPYDLVGNLLTNLLSVAGLVEEGLTGPRLQSLGHSAGLLAAWMSASSAEGLPSVPDTVDAAKLAAIMGLHAQRHPWAVSKSVIAAALAGDEGAATPMVAISGPRTPKLRAILAAGADQIGDQIQLSVTNSPTRHVLSGNPAALAHLHAALALRAKGEADRRARGQLGVAPLKFTWEPLGNSVPFHHDGLAGAAEAAIGWALAERIHFPAEVRHPVIDPATGAPVQTDGSSATPLRQIVTSILARHHDWSGTLRSAVQPGTVVVSISPLGALSGVTASALRGTGSLVVNPATARGRSELFTAGAAPTFPTPYASYAPRVVRAPDGALRLVNRHTERCGRSTMVLPGMTPSTVDAPIVVAAANGGHLAELAGGGQVSHRIFHERVAELTETLDPGQEVVLNTLYLDPYLWNLQVGKDRLLQRTRAAGAPFCGLTISAGIPEKDEALALLDELAELGIWLNAFKPGTVAQVKATLEIAAASGQTIWLHLEGGAAGGHHSWENLDELLLDTYHLIREHDNVVLAVGGGIGDPQRARELLTGTWAHRHAAVTMPVDAILLGTVTMAALESTASPSVKAALVDAGGTSGFVGRGQVAGGITSGRSGLDADIHFVENSAARAARLLDSVAGNADAVAARREEIIEALSRTAKPYFGDVADMTYAQLLRRFAQLTALGRHGRYEDGRWLDQTHRSRFIALLQRTEARLSPVDEGAIATLFAESSSVDEPDAAIEALVAAHPSAETALLHPADVDHFRTVARMPGKPVPFVPVIDADVRRWYQSDSLWQAHSDLFDADQVLNIPGPTAVTGITRADEPVAEILDRFERTVAEEMLAGAQADAQTAGAPTVGPLEGPDFRLGISASNVAAGPATLLSAALLAPTWRWLGAGRTNPLHRIGSPQEWSIVGNTATWAPVTADGESAILTADDGGALTLEINWPSLGLPGDGSVRLPIEVHRRAGVITFEVTWDDLDAAGVQLLEMFASSGQIRSGDVAAATAGHARSVGSSSALPDRIMADIWPSVFTGLARAGLAGSIFDLVHLRHELAGVPLDDAAGEVIVSEPKVARTEGGLVVTVQSIAREAVVSDRFFVRRSVVDPALPVADPLGLLGAPYSDTPRLTLGSFSITAPIRLESFATVSGDANPIHRCDMLARFVGLPGRIVHGMWTSAAATRAVVETACAGDSTRLRMWSIDFLAPVLPGAEVSFTVSRIGVLNGARIVEVEASTQAGVVAMARAEVAPPRTMYVFPGQGIQSQGMGMEGYARSAAARAVWDAADAHTRKKLGFSILEVVRDNPKQISAGGVDYRHPQGVLNLTQFTQVAMAALAMAQVAEMREANVFDPNAAVAGHSVGEYNALAASAGVIPLEAVVEIVFARGQGMHGLVPRDAEGNSDYRLAVIRPHLAGLSHAQAEQVVNAVAEDTGELCEIVNHNLRGKQYAVAGTVGALEELTLRVGPGKPGRPAILYVPGIDVPFHSSALLGGVADFRKQLELSLPQFIDSHVLVGRYIPNLYPRKFSLSREYVEGIRDVCGSQFLTDLLDDWQARSADRNELARVILIELLAWQFASPVRWIETFELMTTPIEEGGLGIERIVEVGVGTAPTLANLAKGSLVLPQHRGTRPEVFNVEVDPTDVFERSEDPAPVAVEAPEEPAALAAPVEAPAAPKPAPTPAAAPAAAVADTTVDHAVAVRALLALRVGVRPDQLGSDSIEQLVDGASSRRNQVLMDMGKEFGVPAIDGAHEVALPELTGKLAERAGGYRFPGPVLAAAMEGGLTTALGPLGSSAGAVAKRVTGHWGLGSGWAERVRLALALGTREGASRRGGDLATLAGATADELIDAAVSSVAGELGVSVAPATGAATGGGAVDAAAVNELREQFEDLLGDTAEDLLARLGRGPAETPVSTEYREALAKLSLLEAEHGPAKLVAPSFDARRHVLLASGGNWARADVDHLVQAALAAEEAGQAVSEEVAGALVDQIRVHRESDPRIVTTLRYHRDRLADRPAVASLLDEALTGEPTGIPVPELDRLRGALSGEAGEVVAALAELSARPGRFADQVALVTGASPNSIAWAAVAHLLRGGATVVLVTTTDTPQRIEAYRDLERRYAGAGAQLHIIRANLASFADIDGLVEWLVTPTTQEVGPTTREVKPALWPTLVLPFAAAPAGGDLPDAGSDAQLTLRLLLLGVERLVGLLAERARKAVRPAFTVILPMSPNHGTFGGDGSYGESKAALETMLNRWHSESSRWGRATRLIAAEIGWVRGTGLMAANDRVAAYIEQELGVLTYSSEQMGALIAALALPRFAERAMQRPLRIDLSGGLGGRDDLGAALATAVAELTAAARAAQEPADDGGLIDALPNLPATLLHARGALNGRDPEIHPQVSARDMIVMVGIAELGPWGGSLTRHEAEMGRLSAAGVVELAWRCGLITWDSDAGRWTDVESGEKLLESQVALKFRETVEERSGVRLLTETTLIQANGTIEYSEVFLDRPLTKTVAAEAEARALAAEADGATVMAIGDGWAVTLPAGASIRVPRRRRLLRSVGGQFPLGIDPVRHGLDSGVAASIDPLAAWNLVVTAEALADAGVTPEELLANVHPSLVGNTQGTGMGGMASIGALFMDPAIGREHPNDTLQEALGNVVSAHVNQGLVGGYGPMVHPVAACATAAISIEEAVDKIALGKAEIIIGGGWDDLSSEGINGFAEMAATADNDELLAAGLAPHQHSRPGDLRRRGFVEAQGGGSFVICRGSVALNLGLPVRAVVGYAASFGDGVHTSIPAPGLGALGAARGGPDSPLGRALSKLGLHADDVAVVSKHDTSTDANDPNEAYIHENIGRALGRTPGAPLRVISQKALTGHAKGGAAAWQLAGLVDVFQTGAIPGNPNLVSVDPRVTPGECIIVDYRTLRRAEQVRAGVLTSLGFGHVSALVAVAHPDVFLAGLAPQERAEYLARAHSRQVAGARRLLAAQHGGEPVLRRRTDRRLGSGTPLETKARETEMLLSVDGKLPALVAEQPA